MMKLVVLLCLSASSVQAFNSAISVGTKWQDSISWGGRAKAHAQLLMRSDVFSCGVLPAGRPHTTTLFAARATNSLPSQSTQLHLYCFAH